MTNEQSPWAVAVGRIPSGLFILTAEYQGQETGMLASWVQQAGFDPPTISVALARQRYLADWLTAGAAIAVHVLGSHDKGLVKHFARGFDPDAPAFTGLDVERAPGRAPVLLCAAAYVAATTTGYVDAGDHRVFVATVTGGQLRAALEPTIHLRRNGLSY